MDQFKELLLLRRIAARRAPSGKERSADNVIERLMRFVRIGSLQKSVQRLFKFVAHHDFHHTVSVYMHSVWYFTMIFSKIQHSLRICAECIDEYYRHLS